MVVHNSALLDKSLSFCSNIKSPEIRSIFTKFRIDANCTLASLLRSFRNNKITSSICVCGGGEQEVEHALFNCKNKEIISIVGYMKTSKRDIVDT